MAPPGPVLGPAGPEGLTLTWTAGAEPDLAGYEVFRSLGAAGRAAADRFALRLLRASPGRRLSGHSR